MLKNLRIFKMTWLVKIMSLFDRHPWDWLAHVFLGFIIFWLNWVFCLWLGLEPILRFVLFGAVNFVIAVELTQWDAFGVSKSIVIDSMVDLLADLAGIGVAMFFIGVLK